jgi:hypothetical protein
VATKDLEFFTDLFLDLAIAQEVSRRLPTAAARVRALVRSCGVFGVGKVALAEIFSECFGYWHSNDCSTIIIIWGSGLFNDAVSS